MEPTIVISINQSGCNVYSTYPKLFRKLVYLLYLGKSMKRIAVMLVIERNYTEICSIMKYCDKEKKSFDKQKIMSNNRPCETAFGIFR